MPRAEDFLPVPPDLGPPLPRFLALGWPWVRYGPHQTWASTLWQVQRPETPFVGEFQRLPPLLPRGPFIANGKAT